VKIAETSGQLPDLPREPRKVKGKEGGSPAKGTALQGPEETAFSQAFLEASRSSARRSLDEVLQDLDRQGERLAANQNFEELEAYKKLVKEFMVQAAGAAKLRLVGDPAQLDRKVHVILDKVDKELEALAKQVLGRQSPQLRILERLDEIRGMLLDLYK